MKNKRIILTILMLTLSTSSVFALADQSKSNLLGTSRPGLYIGFQSGLGFDNYADTVNQYNTDILQMLVVPFADARNVSFFTSRLALGYTFNRYFSLESGLTAWPDNPSVGGTSQGISGGTYTQNYEMKLWSIDMMAVVHTPITQENRWGIYGKIGLAYASSTLKLDYDTTDSTGPNWSPTTPHYHKSFTVNEISPTLAIGVNYAFSKHWVMTVLDVSTILSSGKKFGDIKNSETKPTSVASTGINYKF